jgi:hypothetical protein
MEQDLEKYLNLLEFTHREVELAPTIPTKYL